MPFSVTEPLTLIGAQLVYETFLKPSEVFVTVLEPFVKVAVQVPSSSKIPATYALTWSWVAEVMIGVICFLPLEVGVDEGGWLSSFLWASVSCFSSLVAGLRLIYEPSLVAPSVLSGLL